MTSAEIRNKFLNFFRSKGHKIVPSAPIVVKDDPTLLFTNAGMNQFKDFFLGNKVPDSRRIADTQRCLRVSGKHNDLEEVGVDTYHHTMFEMLGNWSFGDYFKDETIEWAWELLTKEFKLPIDRLYVTIFEGDSEDKTSRDTESEETWKKFIAPDRIIACGKKDNFWEMGDTGPAGVSSEIHIDLRPDSERKIKDGKELVNADHEQVIELWNLVFIQYNRKADGKLEALPEKHVDTGMGLERLVRAIGMNGSNYDTDLFTPLIAKIEELSGKKYGTDKASDIAFRVIADHIRGLVFTIADGQLPSNAGAGYVVRRILRRAVRYGYSYLDFTEPFLYKLVPEVIDLFKNVFEGIENNKELVSKVVESEERSFLQTLERGISRLNDIIADKSIKQIEGKIAFELYDTYGFPIDLTQLIASENDISVDLKGFDAQLKTQKDRSKTDAAKETGDWKVLVQDYKEEFVGYDNLETEVKITRYRTIRSKGKDIVQLVFNLTPFYPEGGGQVGDTGILTGSSDGQKIKVIDTQKENDVIIHWVESLPDRPDQIFMAVVDSDKRRLTACNHSATHLLHAALKQVLGDHIGQKGSLVNAKHLRFDFSHFAKVEKEELLEIEQIVNQKIRENIELNERRNVPYKKAISEGVTALFGEKYGDTVRVIAFDEHYSKELCGGTHVPSTGLLGRFIITSESSVAAGIRRIEAITSEKADQWVQKQMDELEKVRHILGNPADIVKAAAALIEESSELRSKVEVIEANEVVKIKDTLRGKLNHVNGMNALIERVSLPNSNAAKDLAYQLKNEVENLFLVLATEVEGKPGITVMIEDKLVKERSLNAGQIVRELSKFIQGGGGGQPFFAQAGGKDVGGLDKVVQEAGKFIK